MAGARLHLGELEYRRRREGEQLAGRRVAVLTFKVHSRVRTPIGK